MERIILAADKSGMSIAAFINKLLSEHSGQSARFAMHLSTSPHPAVFALPDYWHIVHGAVSGTQSRAFLAQEGQDILRAIHCNRKTEFEHFGSWAHTIEVLSPVVQSLIPILEAIIPTANEATDGKMTLWLTGVEEPFHPSGFPSGWVKMANLLLFAKMVEFHSSDFEQKLLRCYGPAFQAEDKAIIRSTVSSF
jgi:hypothetical protein